MESLPRTALSPGVRQATGKGKHTVKASAVARARAPGRLRTGEKGRGERPVKANEEWGKTAQVEACG